MTVKVRVPWELPVSVPQWLGSLTLEQATEPGTAVLLRSALAGVLALDDTQGEQVRRHWRAILANPQFGAGWVLGPGRQYLGAVPDTLGWVLGVLVSDCLSGAVKADVGVARASLELMADMTNWWDGGGSRSVKRWPAWRALANNLLHQQEFTLYGRIDELADPATSWSAHAGPEVARARVVLAAVMGAAPEGMGIEDVAVALASPLNRVWPQLCSARMLEVALRFEADWPELPRVRPAAFGVSAWTLDPDTGPHVSGNPMVLPSMLWLAARCQQSGLGFDRTTALWAVQAALGAGGDVRAKDVMDVARGAFAPARRMPVSVRTPGATSATSTVRW